MQECIKNSTQAIDILPDVLQGSKTASFLHDKYDLTNILNSSSPVPFPALSESLEVATDVTVAVAPEKYITPQG